MTGFNYKKAVQALNLIAILNRGEMNKMKAIKIIWLSDRHHLRLHGRTITGDIYYALKNGPVPSNTRDLLGQSSEFLDDDELKYSMDNIQNIDANTYINKSIVNEKVFSVSDFKSLHEVWNKYGTYGKYELRDLSHFFPEWKKFESSLDRGIITRAPMSLIDFFEDAPKEADFLPVDEQQLQASKEIFLQDAAISKVFK
jgi:uncharacterized phage-associated protein